MTDDNGAPGGTTAIMSDRFHNRGTAVNGAMWQPSYEEPFRTV